MHVHQRAAIREALARYPVDVIHMHGVDFHAYLPPPGPPILVTLHLPPEWYPQPELAPARPNTWFNAVSRNQHARCPKSPLLLEPVENGIPFEAFQTACTKRSFALSLGRICQEKGQHLAIDAAKRAGVPLLVAGDVSPYEQHRTYFKKEIMPRLDHARRFIGPVDFARKRRLLTAARCLLLTSLVPETSSLVAREAMACGTPVIAFGKGALPETIDHGQTGFLVYGVDDMASSIGRTGEIDPAVCRHVARERFSEDAMTVRYIQIYRRLAGR
jgi:glycosyltransferase involved in cell wall biosynthesis